MIVDTLRNIGSYAGLSDNFAKAAAFLQTADLSALPVGVAEVDGKEVFVNLQSNHLQPHDPAWEAHAAYADIQLILKGREKFGYAPEAELHPLKEGTDFRSCTAHSSFYFSLTEGQYAIFLPGEPHDPCHPVTDMPETCLKLVVKVKMD